MLNEKFTPEENEFIKKLESNCTAGKWYVIDKKRADIDNMMSALQKMAIHFGTVEFYNTSKDKFKLVYKSSKLMGD